MVTPRARTADTLVLAFDASCSTCRTISERVSAACDGRLRTVGLNDPDVRRWRHDLLGEDSPWAPVLFRLDGGSTEVTPLRAWQGRSIGMPLAKHLGARRTGRVLRALGELRQEWQDVAVTRNLGRGLSRRGVVQIGLGAAVGVMLMSGRTPAIAAPPRAQAAGVLSSTEVRGPKLKHGLAAVLAQQDVVNLVDGRELAALATGSWGQGASGAAMITRRSTGVTRFGKGQEVGGAVSAVAQAEHRLASGGTSRVTVFSLNDDLMLALEETAHPKAIRNSLASLYRMDWESGDLILLRASENGFVDQPAPDSVEQFAIATAAARCIGYPRNDPCGGCCLNGSGAVLVSRCKTTNVVRCVLGGVGCIGCATSCAVVNFACIVCVTATCGTAVVNCCGSRSSSCSSNACY